VRNKNKKILMYKKSDIQNALRPSTIVFISAFLAFVFIFTAVSCKPVIEAKENLEVEKGIEVEVEIKEGMNLTQIAELLEQKGVIDNAFVFRLYVQQQGKEKNLLPGTYTFITGSEHEDILNKIISGSRQVIYKLLIPEGYTVKQIKERILQDIPFIESEELESALNLSNYGAYEFLKGMTSLEGFLFPKTYDVTTDYSALNIIEMMLTQFQIEVQEIDWSYIENSDYSRYDILKIASLIEREAYIAEERELISAVIHNRLKINMILQIDATIRYALDKWDGIVTYDDTEIDSPYNTYKYTGLPPTPICNPGIACLDAALNPADVDYLYYVVIDENTHEHYFSTTNTEHEKAKSQSTTTNSN